MERFLEEGGCAEREIECEFFVKVRAKIGLFCRQMSSELAEIRFAKSRKRQVKAKNLRGMFYVSLCF